MEDERSKKKRNKKKKNKQNKTAEEVAVGGEEETSEDQNHASNGKVDHGQVFEVADAGNEGKESAVSLTRNGPNTVLVESGKQQWLQREAVLEETIRQLQTERDLRIQKEITLENTINQLQNENNLHLQKENTFEEAIKKLQDERSSYTRKEGQLEERINQLVDEKTTWALKENSVKETIANLNDNILRLKVQVVELEESRNLVLQENQQLTENISSLQSQIKDLQRLASTQSSDAFTKLSSERNELKSQVEAACALVERLIMENAELVEKVNELFIELDQRGGSFHPSIAASESGVGSAETAGFSDQGSQTIADMPKSDQEFNSIEVASVKDERIGIHNSEDHHADAVAQPLMFEEAADIVQIPLDEKRVRDPESQVALNDESAVVPISDAPLIGAPFRLISFVSRYVSGADLVNKNSSQA